MISASGSRFDAELFAQLAHQRLAIAFAVGHLAAGKFPPAGHVFACGTLRDQHAACVIEQRRGDHAQPRLHEGVPFC